MYSYSHHFYNRRRLIACYWYLLEKSFTYLVNCINPLIVKPRTLKFHFSNKFFQKNSKQTSRFFLFKMRITLGRRNKFKGANVTHGIFFNQVRCEMLRYDKISAKFQLSKCLVYIIMTFILLLNNHVLLRLKLLVKLFVCLIFTQ